MIISKSNTKLTTWQEIIDRDREKRERFWKKRTLKELRGFIAGANDINAQNKECETPLHHAVRYSEKAEFINEFIKGGADVNAKDKHNSTPLHVAASRPYWLEDSTILIIRKLKDAGADINARNNVGKMPYDLYHPILKNNKEAIKLLKPTP